MASLAVFHPIDWTIMERVCTPNEVAILRAFEIDRVLDARTFFDTHKRWPSIGSIFSWEGAGGSVSDDDWASYNGTLLCSDYWDAHCERTIEAAGHAYYKAAFGRDLGDMPSAHPIRKYRIDADAMEKKA
jgi:hypothetical protein